MKDTGQPSGYILKTERGLNVICLKMIEAVNDRLAAAVDYRNYSVLNKSSSYDNNVAHKLRTMLKRFGVRMNDSTFSGRHQMSTITFLHELKCSPDRSSILEGMSK